MPLPALLLLIGVLTGSGMRPGTPRKRAQRAQRYAQRTPEIHNGDEILVSYLPGVEHGSETGYTEYGCRCTCLGATNAPRDDHGQPVEPWGCQQAAVQAAQQRRALRKRRIAATLRLPRQVPRTT